MVTNTNKEILFYRMIKRAAKTRIINIAASTSNNINQIVVIPTQIFNKIKQLLYLKRLNSHSRLVRITQPWQINIRSNIFLNNSMTNRTLKNFYKKII